MNWKLSSLIILSSCLATAAPARSQAARRGLSLILVPTESEAVELRSQIQAGASFEAIAVTHSTDPSAAKSGYMGMVNESSLSREFQVALKGLKPGSVSPVTRAAGGFALLKETTAEEDRWRTQHDDAVIALQQGRYPEAVSLFLIAVQQAEKFGAQDIRLAESLNGLAQVYRYQQNHAAAEPRARQSLKILEDGPGRLACRSDTQPGQSRRHHASHWTVRGSRAGLPSHSLDSLGRRRGSGFGEFRGGSQC
jgi:peptidyl-prolyl cis-trans isomerase C